MSKKNHLLMCFVLVIFFFVSVNTGRADAPPSIRAAAAVLMEAKSGKTLYTKNPHQIRPPASLTKIMTAILALEETDLNASVRVSSAAAGKRGSSMRLVRGERQRVEDLLYGLMLPSGNDAAVAIAEQVAGTEAEFARMMTAKARQLGMINTGFQNASGLPAYGHYSTAYDLALLARYALKNKKFSEIVATKEKMVPGSQEGRTRRLINHNKLLWRYKYATGMKTGYTSSAGECLIASAARKGVTLIVVLLKDNNRYADAENLFEYGFSVTSTLAFDLFWKSLFSFS